MKLLVNALIANECLTDLQSQRIFHSHNICIPIDSKVLLKDDLKK